MAVNLRQLTEGIGDKIERLARRCEQEKEARIAAEKQCAVLTEELRRAQEEARRLQSDQEFLKMSYRLAQTPDDVVAARRHLAGLIRDIDRCISKLKE